MDKKAPIAASWFRAEDYQRIREISDDEMIPTFDEFEAEMTKKIAELAARSLIIEKVIIDPDQLLAFAKSIDATTIDANVRSKLAAMLLDKKLSND